MCVCHNAELEITGAIFQSDVDNNVGKVMNDKYSQMWFI